MADYIRRDLAKKRFSKRLMWLKEDVHDEYSGALLDGCEADIELLDEIPAADVAEVVRCKDCKYSTLPSEFTQRYGKLGTLTCHNRYAPCNRRNVGGDDFCSYGERREE